SLGAAPTERSAPNQYSRSQAATPAIPAGPQPLPLAALMFAWVTPVCVFLAGGAARAPGGRPARPTKTISSALTGRDTRRHGRPPERIRPATAPGRRPLPDDPAAIDGERERKKLAIDIPALGRLARPDRGPAPTPRDGSAG